MGGGGMDYYERVSPPKRTLVLVGRTGNGKSATGNSILGRKGFKSARQMSGVTETCELQETTMVDRMVVDIIDTPGLFDSAANSDFDIPREIVKCIDLAKDGIHAFLVVLSTGTRFSSEEDATIRSLQNLFGAKISNYMIVVFTGGDDIPCLSDYLESGCPDKLKTFISLCGGRVVLFDNKTTDKNKKAQQVRELLSLVDDVLLRNDGQPFTNEYFHELKKGSMMPPVTNGGLSSSDFLKSQELLIEKMIGRIELKMKETTGELKSQLAEEQSARLREEHIAHEAHEKLNDEVQKLREDFNREIQGDREKTGNCSIL